MIITGKEIIECQKRGEIFITRFSEKKVNTNSYNLTLNNKLLIYNDRVLDLKKDYTNNVTEVIIPESGFTMDPGKLYLGSTNEKTITQKHFPIIQGRSSLARLGLGVHITSNVGEIGYNGYWTLELSCVQPLTIYPFIQVCQVFFLCVDGEVEQCDNEWYQNNKGAQTSRIYKELERDQC